MNCLYLGIERSPMDGGKMELEALSHSFPYTP